MFLSKLGRAGSNRSGGGGSSGNTPHDSHSESSRSGEGQAHSGGKRSDASRSHPSSPAARQSNMPENFVVARNDFSKLGTTVRQVLDNPALAKRFKDYAATLHADEGLLFLDDLKAAHDHPDQRAAADAIMRRFFLDDAEHQVNLPDGIRSELLEKYNAGNYANVEELFNDTTYEVFTDLKKSDTFRNFLGQDEEAKRTATNEALLLDGWLTSENFRDALQAVGGDQVLANMVRFCSSVSDFEREDDKTSRKARGNKIAATFVQTGSTFQIVLPKYYEEAILNGKYQILADARTELLQPLSQNLALMETVRKGLTAVRPSASYSRDYSAASHVPELQALLARGAGKLLVQKFIETRAEEASKPMLNKMRFCSAVAGFMAMPGSCEGNSEKLALARKIVSTYVQVGSLYQVDLAAGFVEDLCNTKHPDYIALFSVIYQQFVSDLGSWNHMEAVLTALSPSE